MSKRSICRYFDVSYNAVIKRQSRNHISLEQAIDLCKRHIRTFGKRIDGLSVREYCKKYGIKHEKEFYRQWEAING